MNTRPAARRAALLLTLGALLMSTFNALTPLAAQSWRPLGVPPGAEYLKLAANATVANELVLWHTTAQIADSARQSVITPWIFSRTTNGGGSWQPIDSGSFYYVTTSPATSFQSSWGDVSHVGTQITRIVREQGGLDFRNSTLERSIDGTPFRTIAYPERFTMAGPSDRVHLVENNTAYYLRARMHPVFDSSSFCLVQLRGEDTTWTPHPSGVEQWHVGPPAVMVGTRLNAQNVFMLATMEGLLRSADNGESWSAVVSGTQLDVSRVEQVLVHPRANVPMYAIARRSGGDGLSRLYRSTDQGNVWTEIYADTLITHIALSRASTDMLLIASQGDLLASSDAGATWRSVRGNLDRPYGRASILSLHLDAGDPARAYIATARTIFVTDNWLSAERPANPIPRSVRIDVAPNPVRIGSSVRLTLPSTAATARLTVHDLLGRLVHEQALPPSHDERQLLLASPSRAGAYILSLHGTSTLVTGRLIVLP